MIDKKWVAAGRFASLAPLRAGSGRLTVPPRLGMFCTAAAAAVPRSYRTSLAPREERIGMTQITVTVNGTTERRDVEPRMLLVHLLRDDLRLTGTHVGCDTSQCGACTVLLDGAAVKSCTVLAVQADGAAVTTIEGVATEGQYHPMQTAFWEQHGLQCGFCTPGMIMASIELLNHNPNPSEADIRHGLEGNICRCTGYHNIVKAVSAAAMMMPSPHAS